MSNVHFVSSSDINCHFLGMFNWCQISLWYVALRFLTNTVINKSSTANIAFHKTLRYILYLYPILQLLAVTRFPDCSWFTLYSQSLMGITASLLAPLGMIDSSCSKKYRGINTIRPLTFSNSFLAWAGSVSARGSSFISLICWNVFTRSSGIHLNTCRVKTHNPVKAFFLYNPSMYTLNNNIKQ